MSRANGVRCDICKHEVALLKPDGAYPDGWGTVRLQRGKEFLDTGYLELCVGCFGVVHDVLRENIVKKLEAEISDLKWRLEDV